VESPIEPAAGVAPQWNDRYRCADAANDSGLPRLAPAEATEDAARVSMRNWTISAWYAISGTAMA
jgi:hypothetical protein